MVQVVQAGSRVDGICVATPAKYPSKKQEQLLHKISGTS